jgi:hypothetical protein
MFWKNVIYTYIQWHITHTGDRRGAYWVLMEKPEGNRPLGRLRHRWENNNKTDLRKWDVGACT